MTPTQSRSIAIAAGVIVPVLLLARFPGISSSLLSSSYLPHGFCFRWDPALLWLHVVSDTVIWISYTVIALTLVGLVYSLRQQIRFQSVFLLFGTFIIACGFTHLLDVVVLWKPLYWLQGDLKLLTALASVVTAVALPFYAPALRSTLRQAATSAENERRFLTAAKASLDSFYILESLRDASAEIIDFRFTFVNARGADLIYRKPEEVTGQTLLGLLPENRAAGFFDLYKRVVETGEPFVDEFAVDFASLNASWLKLQVIKLEDGVAITSCDISEHKRLEQERAQALAQSLIESSPAAVLVTDLQFAITAINPAAEKMLWYPSDEVVGRLTPLVFYDPAEVELRAHELSIETGEAVSSHQAIFFAGHTTHGEHEREWTFVRKGGTRVTVQVTVTPLKGASTQPAGFMITAYDVSERKRREEYISHLAHHDVLTGLPSRQLLMDRLEMMISRSQRFVTKSALLMLDLNNFKRVNDSLGHRVGDRLLVQVAERLRSTVRAMDTVARMGGDEFVVLISDLESASAAEQVAKKLLAVFYSPFLLNEQADLEMTASVGVCIFPDSGTDSAALLRNADIAMYHAKATRRHSYQVFDREIADLVLEQREMEIALAGALEASELSLHYQPQFSLGDGTMVGVEALLRWKNARFGPVSPGQFIPIAEASGLILPIGVWVVRSACEELRRLQSIFGSHLVMAVNLSARQLEQPDLLQVIEHALAQNRLDPTTLEIEITESLLMSDSPYAAAFFDGLRRLGVRVAIDDFGTGFSSMSYLLRFAVDRLKIDRCFIQDSSTNANSATVTSAIIALAHQLKVSVVAEGVESEDQMDFLRSAGCDDVQGFYLCRPAPSEQIISSMAAHSIAT